jgi:hypothetical protein
LGSNPDGRNQNLTPSRKNMIGYCKNCYRSHMVNENKKLSKEQINYILDHKEETYESLGRKFNVSGKTIKKIIINNGYKY